MKTQALNTRIQKQNEQLSQLEQANFSLEKFNASVQKNMEQLGKDMEGYKVKIIDLQSNVKVPIGSAQADFVKQRENALQSLEGKVSFEFI